MGFGIGYFDFDKNGLNMIGKNPRVERMHKKLKNFKKPNSVSKKSDNFSDILSTDTHTECIKHHNCGDTK